MKTKLYLIRTYEAYMLSECGVNVVTEMPKDTPYYKHEVLQETELPISVENADIVTEQEDGSTYVTSLVTENGITPIKRWIL